MQRLKCTDFDLSDTAVGRQKALMKQQMMAAAADLSYEDWKKVEEIGKRKWGEI